MASAREKSSRSRTQRRYYHNGRMSMADAARKGRSERGWLVERRAALHRRLLLNDAQARASDIVARAERLGLVTPRSGARGE